MIAFRCKSCGHLVRAEAAGEHAVPHACPVCKAGVEFDAQDQDARAAIVKDLVAASQAGDAAKVDDLVKRMHNLPLKKTLKPDNWEVLADATKERLKELGIDREVVRHQPFKTTWAKDAEGYSVPTHTRLAGASTPTTGQHHERSAADSVVSRDSAK